jgi:hypothetical protein
LRPRASCVHQKKTTWLLERAWARWQMTEAASSQEHMDESSRNAEFIKFLSHFPGVVELPATGDSAEAKLEAVKVEAATAAVKMRVAVLAQAKFEVLARAAELELLEARRDVRYFRNVSSGHMSKLEDSMRQARADVVVANAKIKVLEAEMKVLQLKAEKLS